MTQFLAPIINEQQLDANGAPLSGGTISVYLAGSSTPATTYSDKTGLVPNTWPIVLNTLGVNSQGEVWITGGTAYKFIIKDSAGVVQRTLDNVSGINDTAVTADQWVVYQGTPTYVSGTSFTVPGDQTQAFAPGTRVKTINTGGIVYGTVVRAVYSTSTTVTIIPDGGSLDSGLSTVMVGIITGTNPSLPGNLTTPPFRNRILNAQFRNDQRNAGASQTLVAAATAYTVDRFYASCTGANASIRRVAGTGYQYAVTLTGAASVASSLFGQRIESFNCYDWANKQINVQVPISASGISSVTWNAYTADVSDNFSAKTLIGTGTLNVSSTVDTKYFSFSAGSNAIRGVAIEFVTGALGAGQSITYQGAIQAEANQVSTFEVIEVGEDLHRCQRYFQSSYDSVAPGTAASTANRLVSLGNSATAPGVQFFVKLPVRMRAAPTITLYNPTTGASGSMRNESTGTDLTAGTFGSPGVDFFCADNSAAAAAVANVYGLHYTASAEL